MATLIQSKQIEGIVTASVVEGGFTVSGSIIATGDITASSISSSGPIYGVRYDDIQGTPSFVGGTGILITQVGDSITITNTGGGGGVSGSAELISSVAQLNSYTGSNDIIIVGLQSQIDSLIAQTGSYETKGRGIVSGSDQLTSSLDSRYALSGSVGGGGVSSWNDLADIPSGIVSSSEQVLGGSGVLSGSHTDISSLNDFTSSIQSQVDALINATSSYLTSETDNQTLSIVGDQLTISDGNTITIPTGSGSGTSDFTQLTNVPSGLVSSSEQISLAGVDGFNSYFTSVNNAQIAQDARLTSLESFTSSVETQIGEIGTQLNDFSSSYLTDSASIESRLTTLEGRQDLTGSDSQILTLVGDQLTISGGNTVTIPSGSGGTSDFTQLTNVPSGLVSSSDQVLGGTGILSGSHTDISSLNDYTSSTDSRLSNLESFTSSLDATYATDSDLTSLSASIATELGNIQHTQIPSGTISSSQQISDLGFVTSSLEAPFDGNRVVSNTLLGDLYSQSYNAGTTGSLVDFINEVFFPSSAPTATFTNQTGNWNENLATNNTNLVSVSLTDTVDNSPYTLVLSGTNASSLTAVPTNSESSSWEIRANGNLTEGTYSYDVTVGDSTNAERIYSGRTIVIDAAQTGTLSTTGTLYIIESATTGPIYLNSNGRSGTQGGVTVTYSPNYGSQVATNFSSSNPLISINSSNGVLSVGSPISGSGNLSGDTITSTISWEDQYGNTNSGNISVNVATNFAPSLSSTLITNNNTNQATGSTQIVRLTITDTEGDSIPNSGLVWTTYNSTYFSASVSSPYMYLYANNTSIPAGTYSYEASLQDVHGFNTRYLSSNVIISQAGIGTLGGDTTSYIIESGLSGSVLRDATGYNGGNPSQLTVSYSPNYGSQVVQSYTSSNSAIVVDNSGNLTLGVDISGSVTQSGDTLTSQITFQDQYGNVGSGSVTVNVFANNAPTANFTDNGLDSDTAVSGSNVGTLVVTDTESNSPFTVTLGGTDGGIFDVSGSSSPFYIQPTGSLSIGDYSIQIVVTDTYGKQATLNETISVSSANDYGVIYVYTQNLGPAGSWAEATYKGIYGISVENGDTPPEVTSFTTATSMLSTLANNDVIGDNTITFASTYTMTLRDTINGSTTLDSALASNGSIPFSGTANILLLYPSGSDMSVPTSIQQTINGTVGGGVPYLNADGGGWGIAGAKLNSITLGTPHLGYSEWFVLGRFGTDGVGSSFQYRIVDADGGSAPS